MNKLLEAYTADAASAYAKEEKALRSKCQMIAEQLGATVEECDDDFIIEGTLKRMVQVSVQYTLCELEHCQGVLHCHLPPWRNGSGDVCGQCWVGRHYPMACLATRSGRRNGHHGMESGRTAEQQDLLCIASAQERWS